MSVSPLYLRFESHCNTFYDFLFKRVKNEGAGCWTIDTTLVKGQSIDGSCIKLWTLSNYMIYVSFSVSYIKKNILLDNNLVWQLPHHVLWWIRPCLFTTFLKGETQYICVVWWQERIKFLSVLRGQTKPFVVFKRHFLTTS